MIGENSEMIVIDLSAATESARVEFVPDEGGDLSLSISDFAVERISQIEQAVVTAEQRLGHIRVG